MYIFRSINKKVGRIVSNLERLGVGHSFGIIDVLHLQTTKPRLVNRKRKRFRYILYRIGLTCRITDRMSTEEIHEIVDNNLHLTFDYMSLTIIATIIVGMKAGEVLILTNLATGLVANSSVIVVAGMLISPLMGPILGMVQSIPAIH